VSASARARPVSFGDVPFDLNVFDGIIAGIATSPQQGRDMLHPPRDFCTGHARGQEQSRQV